MPTCRVSPVGRTWLVKPAWSLARAPSAGTRPATSPAVLQVRTPMCPVAVAVACDLAVPCYSSVTAASDTTAGTPLVPGLGPGATWGLFPPPQEAIFRGLQLNGCSGRVSSLRACASLMRCAGVCVLGGADTVPPGGSPGWLAPAFSSARWLCSSRPLRRQTLHLSLVSLEFLPAFPPQCGGARTRVMS